MKKFRKHLDELCLTDDEARRMDEASIQGSQSPSGSLEEGATIHDEVAMPFPGLQEMPQHAV